MIKSFSKLKFTNLPLVEVALRFTFADSLPLSFTLVNKVSSALRDEFSELGEPTHLEAAPGIESQFEVGTQVLSGAVLSGNSKGLRIGLQDRLLSVRWLADVRREGPPYPSFDALLAAVRNAYLAVSQAASKPVTVLVANMFYVNLIDFPHDQPAHQRYLSENAQLGIIGNAKMVQRIEASWRQESDIDVRFNLQQTKRESTPSSAIEAYKLTTSAGKYLKPESDPFQCISDLHERLLTFFCDLISVQAKEEWGLTSNV